MCLFTAAVQMLQWGGVPKIPQPINTELLPYKHRRGGTCVGSSQSTRGFLMAGIS